MKIAWKTSQHVTCDASNNEISNSRVNKDSMQDINIDASQDFSWDARNNVSWRARNLYAWKARNINLTILIVFSVVCVTWIFEIFENFKRDARPSQCVCKVIKLDWSFGRLLDDQETSLLG